MSGKRAPEAERPEASRTLPLEQAANADSADVVPLHPRVEPPGQVSAPQRAPKPPVLASEALRKELLPPTPASRSGRILLTLVGLAGAAAAVLVGGRSGLGIPLGGAFAALAVLALLPMTYQARAAATVSLAGSGLIVVNWALLQRARLGPAVLLLGVLVLSTALLFRGWHRASWLARALVAVGIAICASWLWSSSILAQLLVLEGAWQTWLPPLLATPLPLLLLLSMLAFMDARSTGGACGWASVLLGWYACFSWSGLLQLGWPAGTASFEIDRVAPAIAIARLGAPLFAIALALGCAQLFAYARAAQRPT